ncbi:MAG TPA: bifunctional ornithine acetyltransferase/N-acetylglutamate synthase, partial [Methanobacterium sp.]
MKIIDGGICAVKEVLAAGACEDEYGVAVIICKNSNAAAVFTSNKVIAEPVKITRKALGNGKLSAIIANSGNANCFTGDQGLEDGKNMAREVADELLLDVNDVAVASTGIIGRKL